MSTGTHPSGSPAGAGLQLTGAITPAQAEILGPGALKLVADLAHNFEARRQELLARRVARQADIDQGRYPDFLSETASIRAGNWTVAPIPADLLDRRVEITGPVDRKMVINALNSGANVFMADFEDSNAPTWHNNVDGQVNMRDAIRRTIAYTSPEGKAYKLNDKVATLMVRPRGWHLNERHVLIEGKPISGSLFDFGLFFYNNHEVLRKIGSGPYFYLPKLESHLEARLWNDVFNFAQDALGVPRGTIRGTVLIETIFGAFEMDEILYELKDHSAGLNCGRWDYMFSFIKKFRNHADFILPNRGEVTMTRHFLKSYVELLIQTCHKRNIHAMGGMAAQIPIKNNPAANDEALEKVRQDKLREVLAGHDGTWVAHPGLVALAKNVFDEHMKTPNQIANKRPEVHVTAKDLLDVPTGTITEDGVRRNIDIGLQYLESWLRGSGCVPIYNLMEDAATAEISRAQVWQWVKHGSKLDDGRLVTSDMVRKMTAELIASLKAKTGGAGKFDEAGKIFEHMMTAKDFTEFLTLAAYGSID